jgi:type I phosphodiesterase/nucleotide pyrophosphatase
MTAAVSKRLPDPELAASPSPGSKLALSITVLIDALGWKYIEGRPFLNDWLPYRTPLRTVLGFSSGAIPTILTGEYPSQTGHWNLFYYDPSKSPFRWLRHFQWLPDRLLDNRVSRKLLQQLGRHFLGLGPLFSCAVSPRLLPHFNWVERRSIYAQQGITGAPSIFDQLATRGIPHRVYTYHHGNDAQLLRRAAQDVSRHAATFFFVYLSGMDEFLHLHCKEPQSTDGRVNWYAHELQKLFTLARTIDPNVALTVTSDHGMTPVEHTYDILPQMQSLNLKMPQDYLAVYDSTMVRFWFFNTHARSSVQQLLLRIPCGHVLSDDELRRFGVFFEDRRFGETIFLLDPGWLFSRSDFNGIGWFPEGMHGYHPDRDRYSDAIFLSNRPPGFQMRTIKDVYTCIMQTAVASA